MVAAEALDQVDQMAVSTASTPRMSSEVLNCPANEQSSASSTSAEERTA